VSAGEPGEGKRSSEFRLPGDRTWARLELLEAIGRTAPEVLQALHKNVFPLVSAMNLKSRRDYIYLRMDPKKVDKLVAQLRPRLEEWADRFHLRGPKPNAPVPPGTGLPLFEWMETIIASTLLAWDRCQCLDPLCWWFPSSYSAGAYRERPDSFTFQGRGWSVLRETENDFRRRLRVSFEIALNAYIKKRKRGALEAGYPEMPSKCTPEHFNWLVMFQVKRMSHSDIARAAHRTRSTITGAIHLVAELVVGDLVDSWLMPPLPAGRPPRADREVSG
jgi:hypothetical protein